MKKTHILLIFSLISISCEKKYNEVKLISRKKFETAIDGKKIDLYTLKNSNGLVTQITNYGGRVVSLWVPDKNGNFEDIVLGYETIGVTLRQMRYISEL